MDPWYEESERNWRTTPLWVKAIVYGGLIAILLYLVYS